MQPSGSTVNRQMLCPAKPEDWEPYRDIITYLYENHTLKEVIDEMEGTHNFSATQKQYKTKLHLWGLTNKYITGSEYEELIRKGKRHEYYVRNRRVTHRAIVRYQYRKDKRDKAKAAKSLSDSANPPVPTSGDASICGYDSGFDRGNGFEGASNDLGWGHYMTLPLTVGDEHFFDNDGYNYMLAHDTLAASTTEEYTAEHCTYDASGNFIDDIHMGENRHIHQGSSNL